MELTVNGTFWEPAEEWWLEQTKTDSHWELEPILHTSEATALKDLSEFNPDHIVSLPSAVRIHFSVPDQTLSQFSNADQESFYEFVRDTSDRKLLQHRVWLLLRVENANVTWRLRHVIRVEGELESVEVKSFLR
jgi:hypothetical protein